MQPTTRYSYAIVNISPNYIAEGRWTSMQTLQEGAFGQQLLKFVTDQDHLAQRNMLPEELKPPEEAGGATLYPGVVPLVRHSRRESILNTKDKSAYNVVVLGPTGAGKSSIINLMFNKRICRAGDDIDSVTRNMEFHVGEGMTPGGIVKRINIIDSVGFCDSHFSSSEVYNIIKESVAGNCLQIHKVLIITSGRLQKDHQDSIKKILEWLQYDARATGGPSMSVNFIYTKTDGQSEDQKQRNLTKMVDLLGATCGSMHVKLNGVFTNYTNALAVSFPPTASFADIKEDYSKLKLNVFEIPSDPISLNRSSCVILWVSLEITTYPRDDSGGLADLASDRTRIGEFD